MKKWIKEKGKALAIVIVVLLCRIKSNYSVPLPGSTSEPPAKVKEKIYFTSRSEQPSKSKTINPNTQKKKARASSPSELLKKAKKVRDLNPDSQKLFKEFIKEKLPFINIDKLPMNDFEKNSLRRDLPRLLNEPDFADHFLDNSLSWAKMHDASIMDVVISYGASKKDYLSYIKEINKNSDIEEINKNSDRNIKDS